MTKPTKAKDPAKLEVHGRLNETKEQAMSRLLTTPALQATLTLSKFADQLEGIDMNKTLDLVSKTAADTSSGDLAALEGMLAAQACTLDVIFNNMARRAAVNLGEHLQATDLYLKLALRAQSQCRSTIEALAEIKNPKAVYISGQANISHGPQQVNNHARPDTPAHARSSKPQNKQSEGSTDELHSHTGTPAIEKQADSSLEALGKVNRPEVIRRQNNSESERLQGRYKAHAAYAGQGPA